MPSPISRRRALSLSLSALPWLGLPACAHALAQPSGPVVLSVGGRVARPNREGRAQFDMAMLAALPQRSVTQKTPWYPQARKFTGPLLREVLAAAGAQGQRIEASAINDYKVTIPMEDVQRYDVMVARLLDDQPMPLRDKGPLFVIYPFDSAAGLRTSIYYSRSIWQLKALDVQ